jgi:hypothetical protein
MVYLLHFLGPGILIFSICDIVLSNFKDHG